MDLLEDKWAKFHEKALPYEQAIKEEPFRTLLDELLKFIQSHWIGNLVEAGFGTGYMLIALAWHGHFPEGIESSEVLNSRFHVKFPDADIPTKIGDIFDGEIYKGVHQRIIIYHQGLLEHFSDIKIRELLKLQIENSFAVIFSVPSFFYGRQDFGDERLLTIEQWQEILTPFDFFRLEYYDNKKHILGVMKGDFYGESE